jgi:hypothetical protein
VSGCGASPVWPAGRPLLERLASVQPRQEN